jgi:hypothetical protein
MKLHLMLVARSVYLLAMQASYFVDRVSSANINNVCRSHAYICFYEAQMVFPRDVAKAQLTLSTSLRPFTVRPVHQDYHIEA